MDLQGTEVGVKLCNMAGGLDEAADVLQMLIDCFARKATATVLKRTSSLRALAGWMVDSNQTTIWSMTEQQLYNFMCAPREQHAAPTQASHLLEALNFLDNALKFRKMVCKDLLSSRVVGAAHSMYLEKRKLKQAPRIDGGSSESLGDSMCQQYQLVEDCSFWEFCYFAFLPQHVGRISLNWRASG